MKAPRPPSGPLWLHEVKHDGFRVIARKDGERVMLYSRPGNDLTNRFPRIVEAMARLPSSCTIYGEAVACDDGIVSKRKDSRYVSGRSPYWLKTKNPAFSEPRRLVGCHGRKSPEDDLPRGSSKTAREMNWGFFSSDQYLAMTATGALPQSNLQFKPVRKT
jgi:ATP dependent DNA ligase domain